jgi:hypothetical protein
MLLQTNSYVVGKDKRPEHARMVRKFRQTLARLGCDQFDVFEQVGANWAGGETTGRFVQMMRFRDRKHQLAVQNAEKQDAAAQQLIAEFCALIDFPYQQQQNLFAVGFYQSVLPVAPLRVQVMEEAALGGAQEFPDDPGVESVEDPHAGGGAGGLRIVGDEPADEAGAQDASSNNGEDDRSAR